MEKLKFNIGPLKGLFSGVAIGYAITFIVFIVYALLITYSNVSESKIDMVIVITTILSVVIAGFDAAKMANSRGLLWGVVAGGVYAIILIIIGAIINDGYAIGNKAISSLFIAMSGGGIGGIIGINFKK